MTKEKDKNNNSPLVSKDAPTKVKYSDKYINYKRPSPKKKSGITLEDRYAKLIRRRKKREIISTEDFKNYIGKELLLCGKNVYGSIILNEPVILDKKLLKNHYKRHLITDYDTDRLWPNEKKFYAYSFRITKMFKKPIEYKNKNLGIIDLIEFENKSGIDNLNKEHYHKLKNEREQEELLPSNSRYDKYYSIINSLKALEFVGKYKDVAGLFVLMYTIYLEKSNSKIYDNNGVVLKPVPDVTENYIRIRIRDPKTIVEGSFRTITISDSQGIKAVIGKLRKDPSGSTKVQSVLFDKKKWDTKRAVAWVKEHKESLKNKNSNDLKEKIKVYVPIDKDTGKQEEKLIFCDNCHKHFDYYKQLLDDKSTIICPNCGALVIYEEEN